MILGIHDGTHDAGAALVDDGRIVAACNEERFTRVKGQSGWPAQSIDACFQIAGARPQDIDAVAFAGFVNPNPVLRTVRPLQKRFRLDDGWFYSERTGALARAAEWLQFGSPFPRLRSDGMAMRTLSPILRRLLARMSRPHGPRAGLHLHDHHLCHAAGAWRTGGRIDTLVIVADGVGDGLALTIYRGSERGLERLAAMAYPHSYGFLYATITGFLGFRPFRHEGKLVGLAALGDPDAVRVPFPFRGPPEAREFTEQWGRAAWLAELRAYRREDVCAWLQRGIESELCALVDFWTDRTGIRNVVLSGGVFANVRLNQKLGQRVDRLFVHPHMGDGGLAVGAAMASSPSLPKRLGDAYLGPAFPTSQLEDALRREALPVRRVQDVEEQVADRLARGWTVARFDGPMEYGPRALGNRSILASAADVRMTDRLNLALTRSDFMPFAPVMLADDADDWVEGLAPVREAAEFMTVTVQARANLVAACPAAVHVDGSLRPQLVGDSPSLRRILQGYRRRTGIPAVINTSFNLHEEPIVHSPAEAIATWRSARLDTLALGPFLVDREAA